MLRLGPSDLRLARPRAAALAVPGHRVRPGPDLARGAEVAWARSASTELLALPNDAINPPDVVANVAFLERVPGARLHPAADNGDKPPFTPSGRARGARTVLFYMHLDGQPVVDREWSQPSPWKPVVKKRNAAGGWDIVAGDALFAPALDPELRVFGRSASDDKAPITMFLAAFDGLKQAAADPAIHVKVLIDSEEEKGSPSIRGVATAQRRLLACDALIILDGPRHQSERPTIVFGNRGVAQVHLVVYGPRQPLHSGHFGNYVPNPAMRLAPARDDEGRRRPGHRRRLLRSHQLTAADRKVLAETGDDARPRSAAAPASGPPIRSAATSRGAAVPLAQRPRHGSASVGDKAANIVPHQAVAELDLRTTPETPPEYLFSLLQRHVQAQGLPWSTVRPATKIARPTTSSPRSPGRRRQPRRAHARSTPGSARGLRGAQPDQPARRSGPIRMMGGSVPDRQPCRGPRRAVHHRAAGQRRQQPARLRREHAHRPLRRGRPRDHRLAAYALLSRSRIRPVPRWQCACPHLDAIVHCENGPSCGTSICQHFDVRSDAAGVRVRRDVAAPDPLPGRGISYVQPVDGSRSKGSHVWRSRRFLPPASPPVLPPGAAPSTPAPRRRSASAHRTGRRARAGPERGGRAEGTGATPARCPAPAA